MRRSNYYACSLDLSARELVYNLAPTGLATVAVGFEWLSPGTADLGLEGPVAGTEDPPGKENGRVVFSVSLPKTAKA